MKSYFFLWLLLVALYSCQNEQTNAAKILEQSLNEEKGLSGHSEYYVILITDLDCSECNISFIAQWINSMKADNQSIPVYFMFFQYHTNANEQDFQSIKTEFRNEYFVIKDFKIVKNAALAAGVPSGPFVIKVSNNHVIYSRRISEPFL